MTEAEWLRSTDLWALVSLVAGRLASNSDVIPQLAQTAYAERSA
jgi:hypothetical protein